MKWISKKFWGGCCQQWVVGDKFKCVNCVDTFADENSPECHKENVHLENIQSEKNSTLKSK